MLDFQNSWESALGLLRPKKALTCICVENSNSPWIKCHVG